MVLRNLIIKAESKDQKAARQFCGKDTRVSTSVLYFAKASPVQALVSHRLKHSVNERIFLI